MFEENKYLFCHLHQNGLPFVYLHCWISQLILVINVEPHVSSQIMVGILQDQKKINKLISQHIELEMFLLRKQNFRKSNPGTILGADKIQTKWYVQ